ncbi:MotE family protein [Alloyangia pacifica]|uniref:MotE family protein n=1 Tax=Alloyangia pacifica TaxID=311180 RepID=UPI0031D5B532
MAAVFRKLIPGRGRGALGIISALMIVSAILRLGAGAAQALDNLPKDGAAEQDVMAGRGDKAAPADGADPIGTCMGEEDLAPALAALRAREADVAQRETDLRSRQQALQLAESTIDQKLAAMEETEQRLRATLAMAETAAEDDVAQLTQVYANMKPREAAAVFSQMEPDFAAGFLGRMRPDAAAAILSGMDPQAAYTISVMLAGRNANAPKN